MRLSASRLKVWQTCQAQAKFKYVDLLPQGPENAKAVFGKIIHVILESFVYDHDLDRAIARFKDLWQNPEKMGVGEMVWPKYTSYGGLKDKGIELLKTLNDTWKWETFDVIAVEQEFVVPFGRHEFHGFIDRLDVRKSGKGKDLLRAVDYKTNAKAPNKGQLFLDIQFTVYLYALTCPEFWEQVIDGAAWYQRVKDLNSRGIWFQLMDAREIDAGTRDETDFGRLMRLCDSIEAAHEAGVFVPHIGEPCELCPFTEPCGQYVPTREEVAAQDGAWI